MPDFASEKLAEGETAPQSGGMIYSFGPCELDIGTHVLRRDGAEVHVEPQVFDVIAMLVEAAGELVTYDALIERVWEGRIVSDATIAARVSAARAALGDDGKRQAVIRTVPRRGLQIVVPVGAEGPAEPEEVAQESGPVTAQMTLSRDGSVLAWTSEGQGPPLMRAGHWLTHLELDRASPIWSPFLQRLGRGRRLVRYDFRGTGMSDPECGAFDVERFTDDMEAVADAAGLERFPIFASSQSFAVSCHFALRHPERVSAIVSCGGYAQGSFVREGGADATFTKALHQMIVQGWGQPEGGMMKAFATLFIPHATNERIAQLVNLQIASATPDRAVEIRECISRFDVVELLPKVQCPVLVLHARNDAVHPFAQARLIAQGLPDARLKMLDSPNHILMSDEPAFAQAFDALDAFLAEVT